MNLKLNREVFSAAFDHLKIANSDRISQIAGCVLIQPDTESNILWLSSTDFLLYMTLSFNRYGYDFEWENPEPLVISLDKIATLISASTDTMVTITTDGTSTAKIKANGNYSIPISDPSLFPAFDYSGDVQTKLSRADFVHCWSVVSSCISKDVTKDWLRGVCYHGPFAATDEHRICFIDREGSLEVPVIIPEQLGAAVLKTIEAPEVEIFLNPKGHVIFKASDSSVFAGSPCLNGQFPGYRAVWNNYMASSKPSVSITCKTAELRGAIMRLLVVTDTDDYSIRFEVPDVTQPMESFSVSSGGLMNETGREQSGKEAIEAVAVESHDLTDETPKSFTSTYSATYLYDLCRCIFKDTVTIRFIDIGTDKTFMAVEEDSTKYLVCNLVGRK